MIIILDQYLKLILNKNFILKSQIHIEYTRNTENMLNKGIWSIQNMSTKMLPKDSV